MCSYPYPINEIEMDELEEQLIEQEINSFDEVELNEYNLYTDENDELETILCIEDVLELTGCCLISSYE
jgi:hypothetical protein